MQLTQSHAPSTRFTPLIDHVERVQKQLEASAAASYVIQRGEVVCEWYAGTQTQEANSRPVQADSQFNVASVRKSYIGLAIALLLDQGKIKRIDDLVTDYLHDVDTELLAGTTVRHLLTHSHGLEDRESGETFVRLNPPGEVWRYQGCNILMLCRIVESFGHTVAGLLQEHVFTPLAMTETAWRETEIEQLVPNYRVGIPGPEMRLHKPDGHDKNLFVSARELAYWGYFHLKKGRIDNQQILPEHIFNWTTTVQSPDHPSLIQNGFLWYLNENKHPQSELGEDVPSGSFQILGMSGCAVLVIPELDAVAVRMYNRSGSPAGYDYLRDIKDWGNLVTACLR